MDSGSTQNVWDDCHDPWKPDFKSFRTLEYVLKMTRPVTSWSRKRCDSVYYWDKFLKDCQVSPDKLKPNFIQSFLVLEISCSNVKWNFVDHATISRYGIYQMPKGEGVWGTPLFDLYGCVRWTGSFKECGDLRWVVYICNTKNFFRKYLFTRF